MTSLAKVAKSVRNSLKVAVMSDEEKEYNELADRVMRKTKYITNALQGPPSESPL